MKKYMALIMMISLVGCGASQQNQKALADAQAGCAAGNADACTAATYQMQVNQQEAAANSQAAAGLGAALLGAAIVGADVAAASHSNTVYYVPAHHYYHR